MNNFKSFKIRRGDDLSSLEDLNDWQLDKISVDGDYYIIFLKREDGYENHREEYFKGNGLGLI